MVHGHEKVYPPCVWRATESNGSLNDDVNCQGLTTTTNYFPEDFAFRLTLDECSNLKSQFATSSLQHGGVRKLPTVFTEHGAIMAANVLNSLRAEEMSVYVVRAFIRLRGVLAAHKELADQLAKLERRVGTHDRQIQAVFETIRQLMTPPDPPRRKIGFQHG